MVARQFIVRHNDSQFLLDYDTDDGFEVIKFQIFSVASNPPVSKRQRRRCSSFSSTGQGKIEGNLKAIATLCQYDVPVRQEAAPKSVPMDELEGPKALVSLAKEGKFKPSKEEKDHALPAAIAVLVQSVI